MSTDQPPKPTSSVRRARSATRVRQTCLAWVEGESEQQELGLARTIDLSPRGAGLVLSRPVPALSRVVLDLLLPGALCLRGEGKVVHCVPLDSGQFRIGVSFPSPPFLVDAPTKETT